MSTKTRDVGAALKPVSPEAINVAAVLGAVIHTHRASRSLSQQELAARAGLHAMTLSKIERGAQQDVGVVTLSRIATALSTSGVEVRASELLAEAERWQRELKAEASRGELTGPRKNRHAAFGELSGPAMCAAIVRIAGRTGNAQ